MSKKRSCILLILWLYFLSTGHSNAQEYKVDSLIQEFGKGKNEEALHPIFISIVKQLKDYDGEAALSIVKRIERITDNPNLLQQIYIPLLKADVHKKLAQKKEQIALLESTLPLAEKNKLLHASAYICREIAYAFNHQQYKLNTLNYFLRAAQKYDSLQDYYACLLIYEEMASLEFWATNHEEVIKLLDLFFENYKKLDTVKLAGDLNWRKMNAYNTYGVTFTNLKRFNEAIEKYDKAMAIAIEREDAFWQGLIKGNLGRAYRGLNNYPKAIELFLEDFKMSMKHNIHSNAANASCNIIDLYSRIDSIDLAKIYLDSLNYLVNIYNLEVPLIPKYYQAHYKYFNVIGDYENAFHHLEKYFYYKDSLQKSLRARERTRLHAQFESEKKQGEIALLTKEREVMDQEIQNKNLVIYGGGCLVLLLLLLTINYYRSTKRRKRDNEKIESQKNRIEEQVEELAAQGKALSEQNHLIQKINENLEKTVQERTRELLNTNKELDTFLYRSSHDMRSPIVTILGLSNLIHSLAISDEVKSIGDKVAGTAVGMNSMLDKLQMALELNKNGVVNKTIDWSKIIDSVQNKYKPLISSFGIKLHTELPENGHYQGDSKLVQIILDNLVENAIYFCKKGSNEHDVHIRIYRTSESMIMEVKDDGIGIDESYLNRIFDLYYKASQNSRGNGLGLYLANKAVEKLKGRIHVESKLDAGSTFQVILPI
ncbi:tetratricopeptide repeat-containing sensor histidine kinase [Fulvivirgaceae bacterium BMA10]|uniref:histidine kinase n=1 Tax=Splendidivirga corallicola TaxID=3051826 RepID=A0ABT8KTU4_9BACT|nr:tetratricopeptide repeat-containing sensor histidine kinase [Fulvivirgaceae bacterium BMA10]